MMLLEKNGIRVEHFHPADIARMKKLGYREVVIAVDVAPPAEPVPEPEPTPTPEAANEEAIQAVNESKPGSKTKEGKK